MKLPAILTTFFRRRDDDEWDDPRLWRHRNRGGDVISFRVRVPWFVKILIIGAKFCLAVWLTLLGIVIAVVVSALFFPD